MNNSLQKIYEDHHKERRGDSFVLLESERAKFLQENIGSEKKILDIGCRDGALTKHFNEGNNVTGYDIDMNALQRAHDSLGIEIEQIDLNNDWHTDIKNTFDVVVAGEVLEHVYYPNEVIRKSAAALKEGGIFIGSVPNAFSLKNRLRILSGTKKHTPLSDPTHINHFHTDELKAILEKEFSSVKMSGLGTYKKLIKLHHGFFAYDIVFVCKK